MNKIFAYLLAFIVLFGIASSAMAVEIPNPLGQTKDFGTLLLRIAWYVGLLIGSLGSIMIVIAGILYLTSAGSPEKMATAKKAFFYAIIGIAIGVSATTIVSVVLEVLKT